MPVDVNKILGAGQADVSDIAQSLDKLATSMEGIRKRKQTSDINYMGGVTSNFKNYDDEQRTAVLKSFEEMATSGNRVVAETARASLPSLREADRVMDSKDEWRAAVDRLSESLDESVKGGELSPDIKALMKDVRDKTEDNAEYLIQPEIQRAENLVSDVFSTQEILDFFQSFKDIDEEKAGMQADFGIPGSVEDIELSDAYKESVQQVRDSIEKMSIAFEEGIMTPTEVASAFEGLLTHGGDAYDFMSKGISNEISQIDQQGTNIVNTLSGPLNSILSDEFKSSELAEVGAGLTSIVAEGRTGEWESAFDMTVGGAYALLKRWGKGSTDDILDEHFDGTSEGQLEGLLAVYRAMEQGSELKFHGGEEKYAGVRRILGSISQLGELQELKESRQKLQAGIQAEQLAGKTAPHTEDLDDLPPLPEDEEEDIDDPLMEAWRKPQPTATGGGGIYSPFSVDDPRREGTREEPKEERERKEITEHSVGGGYYGPGVFRGPEQKKTPKKVRGKLSTVSKSPREGTEYVPPGVEYYGPASAPSVVQKLHPEVQLKQLAEIIKRLGMQPRPPLTGAEPRSTPY